MAAIKSTDTKPELVVRRLLHGMGFRYRLHNSLLPGKPDIVLTKYKTVVFVHGCFWHHHKNCARSFIPKSNKKYWRPKIFGNIERDKRNARELKKLGWKIITIWECQINKANVLRSKFIKKIT